MRGGAGQPPPACPRSAGCSDGSLTVITPASCGIADAVNVNLNGSWLWPIGVCTHCKQKGQADPLGQTTMNHYAAELAEKRRSAGPAPATVQHSSTTCRRACLPQKRCQLCVTGPRRDLGCRIYGQRPRSIPCHQSPERSPRPGPGPRAPSPAPGTTPLWNRAPRRTRLPPGASQPRGNDQGRS